jgi:hypothetical protein
MPWRMCILGAAMLPRHEGTGMAGTQEFGRRVVVSPATVAGLGAGWQGEEEEART